MVKRIGRNLARLLTVATLATPALAEDGAAAPHYGADDTIGAVNLLSADGVRQAAGLVTTGKVYALGIVTGPATPAWGERSFTVQISQLGPLGENRVTAHDDRLVSHLGIGTQIDGIAHIGVYGVHYNGFHARDFPTPEGVKVFGVENIPPIVTRGVLLDIAALQEVDRLPAEFAITSEHLAAAAKAQDGAYEFMFVLGTPRIQGAVQAVINPIAIR